MTVDGAYAGLRALDLGQGVAAPYCAMLLAMHGAEIVKLEPVAGDWSRGLGTQYGDHTAMSAHYNRGTKSLALDLKSPAAREIATALAARADPHIVATGGAVAVDQPGMGRFRTPRTPGVAPAADAALAAAPRIGEHGRAILAELGIAAAAIERLAAEGVLRLPAP